MSLGGRLPRDSQLSTFLEGHWAHTSDKRLENQLWSSGRLGNDMASVLNCDHSLHPPASQHPSQVSARTGLGSERRVCLFDSPHSQGHTQREILRNDWVEQSRKLEVRQLVL